MANDKEKETGKPFKTAEAWRNFRKQVEQLTEEGIKGYDQWDKRSDHNKSSPKP